jgi:hypothetical protein
MFAWSDWERHPQDIQFPGPDSDFSTPPKYKAEIYQLSHLALSRQVWAGSWVSVVNALWAGVSFHDQCQSWVLVLCLICSCGRAVRSSSLVARNSTESPGAGTSPYSNRNGPVKGQSVKGQKSALLHVRYSEVMCHLLDCKETFLSTNNKFIRF